MGLLSKRRTNGCVGPTRIRIMTIRSHLQDTCNSALFPYDARFDKFVTNQIWRRLSEEQRVFPREYFLRISVVPVERSSAQLAEHAQTMSYSPFFGRACSGSLPSGYRSSRDLRREKSESDGTKQGGLGWLFKVELFPTSLSL
jgi:hypothetical protein